jgi:hypothetical protein
MESLATIKCALLKAFLIGLLLLILGHIGYIFNFDFMYGVCHKLYDIDKSTFINYAFLLLSLSKLIIVFFFFVPWLSLSLAMKSFSCCCSKKD